MQTILTDNFGAEWLTDDCLTIGDYSGAGSVGFANLRWLEKQGNVAEALPSQLSIYPDRIVFTEFESSDFSAVILCNCYGYKQAFIRLTGEQADKELIEATFKLDLYPCYADELVSEVESEWEMEAWEDWVREDLVKYLPGKLVEHIEQKLFPFNEQSANAFYFGAYCAAMESTNTYPVPEHTSCHIDTDRIRNAFIKNVLESVREHHRKRRHAWRRNWLPLPSIQNCTI